jgi:hypothetical protein
MVPPPLWLGDALGLPVGVELGVTVGVELGVTVGVELGVTVGVELGRVVGLGFEEQEGDAVGAELRLPFGVGPGPGTCCPPPVTPWL